MFSGGAAEAVPAASKAAAAMAEQRIGFMMVNSL